jgi:hypothetical protein
VYSISLLGNGSVSRYCGNEYASKNKGISGRAIFSCRRLSLHRTCCMALETKKLVTIVGIMLAPLLFGETVAAL